MAGGVSLVSHYWSEQAQLGKGGKARMNHVILGYSERYQDELTLSLIQI